MTRHAIQAVREELTAHETLRAQLGDDLDPQVLLDTLEGATDLHEALLAVYDQITETEILLEGLTAIIERLQGRKARMQQAKETLRNVILSAMDKAGLETVKGPAVTLYLRRTAGNTVIDDESLIPSKYFERPAPKLNKRLLDADLKDNVEIPGAHISNGGISLTARVK